MSLSAMVLCAGLGTRLRPLTNTLPKPAIPVLDAPLIRTHLAALALAGIREVAINTHHLPDLMCAVAEREADRLGLQLRVSHEPEILGTGGGIREAMKGHVSDLLVVMNGDTLFDVDLAEAVAAHRSSNAVATMVLAPMPAGQAFRAVDCDAAMRVRRIAAESPLPAGLRPWHFTGVHIVGPEFFLFVPPRGACDINREVYPRMISAGLTVAGHVAIGFWSDIGTPQRLLAAHLDFLRGAVPGRLAPGTAAGVHAAAVAADARIVPPVYIGPGARIESGAAVGPLAFVGTGCRVERGAKVAAALVVEATITAGETVENAVVIGSCRVQASA